LVFEVSSLLLLSGIETNIRQATPLDTEIIARFNAHIAWETEQRRLDAARVQQGVLALLNDPAKGTYFVAEVQSNGATAIAGQLLITYEWSDWRNGNFWWIQSVYVAEPFRHQGIFRALFHHVHARAKARDDVCGLRLYMDTENARARQAYQRLGLNHTNYEVFEIDFVLSNLHCTRDL